MKYFKNCIFENLRFYFGQISEKKTCVSKLQKWWITSPKSLDISVIGNLKLCLIKLFIERGHFHSNLSLFLSKYSPSLHYRPLFQIKYWICQSKTERMKNNERNKTENMDLVFYEIFVRSSRGISNKFLNFLYLKVAWQGPHPVLIKSGLEISRAQLIFVKNNERGNFLNRIRGMTPITLAQQ